MTVDPVEDDGGVRFGTWNELRDALEDRGGVLVARMWELRDLEDAGRLGIHVRASIGRRLVGLGIGHLPKELPSSQNAEVVLYGLGTTAASVISAVQGDNATAAAKALRRLNTARDAEKLLVVTEKVAELSVLLNG